MGLGRKLSRHAFLRFWSAHSYVGVASSLLLYLMCLCGSISLFRGPLEVWEEPLLQAKSEVKRSLAESLDVALANIGPVEPELWLHPARGGTSLQLDYRPAASPEWRSAFVVAHTGEVLPQRERLSKFIYELHFLWHAATGIWLYYVAGLLALSMLVALVSGLLIHLKDIPEHLQRFRPYRGARVLWSDLHKLLGVLGLPFQVMYAYTGALLVLGPVLLQAFVGPVFDGNVNRAQQLALGVEVEPESSGPRVAALSADDLLGRVQAMFPTLEVEAIELTHHGYEQGQFSVWGFLPGSPQRTAHVTLAERNGELRSESVSRADASARLRTWVHGLHVARFGPFWVRPAFFVLGLLCCATLLSGNLIWLERRAARPSSFGVRVLQRLNFGIGAGSLVSVTALFFASRALSLEVPRRGAWEEGFFWLSLGGTVLLGCFDTNHVRCWWRAFVAAGLLLVGTPAVGALASRPGLLGQGPHVAPAVFVDAALIALGAALVVSGCWLRSRLASERPKATSFRSELSRG